MTDFGHKFAPTARKDHRCAWCGDKIHKGEVHYHYKGKWQGEFQNWRMHNDCYGYAYDNDYLFDGFDQFDNERPQAAKKEGE
jgi:hypothetical protein